MLKPNRSRNPNQLRIGGDLTPSQLVLAICIFLCAALICFSLGVIVGKYDERNSDKERARIALKPVQPQPNRPPLNVPAPGKAAVKPGENMAKGAALGAADGTAGPASGQGVQTSPRPIVTPQLPGKPGYPESPGSGTGGVQAGPRVSEHPAPPKPAAGDGAAVSGAPLPEQPTAGGAAGAPPAPVPGAEPEKKPAVETAPTATAEPAPEPNKGEGAAESAKTEAPKTEPAKADAKNEPPALEPVAAAGTAAASAVAGTSAPGADTAGGPAGPPDGKKGLYTVQLASLTSATRKEQALGMRKKLEADGLQPELLISQDGARVSVVVGSYPDRQSAQSACNELRKKKGFADCFVRTR